MTIFVRIIYSNREIQGNNLILGYSTSIWTQIRQIKSLITLVYPKKYPGYPEPSLHHDPIKYELIY